MFYCRQCRERREKGRRGQGGEQELTWREAVNKSMRAAFTKVREDDQIGGGVGGSLAGQTLTCLASETRV